MTACVIMTMVAGGAGQEQLQTNRLAVTGCESFLSASHWTNVADVPRQCIAGGCLRQMCDCTELELPLHLIASRTSC